MDVVKSEEGKFYSIRCAKHIPVAPILRQISSVSSKLEGSENGRSIVNFDLNDNEIRDFKKNDKVDWALHRTKLSFKHAQKNQGKKGKKRKGKGKNRKNFDPEAEAKRKIDRAARRRKEREDVENEGEEEEEPSIKPLGESKGISFNTLDEMSVDDDFEFEDDMEACNAPSTRKSNSQQAFDS